jgi:uncharacterized membrane protein YfcA
MASTGMPMRNAVASSLVAVSAFGVTAAANYALSGMVDWRLALVFVAGGLGGGVIGAKLSARLSVRRGTLNTLFAALIFTIALYVLFRSALPMPR